MPVASEGDECLLLPSLELALRGCLAQLRSLRAAQTPEALVSAEYAAEERALKLSLSGIVAQLQVVREAGKARCCGLLLAVAPQILALLSTASALRLASASRAALAAASVGGAGGQLLVPHLDAAPASPAELERFLSGVAIGSVRSLALPPAPVARLLRERASELGSLEALALPRGFIDFGLLPEALPCLPSLRRLTVDAGRDLDEAAVANVTEALQGLAQPLSLLCLEALEPGLAAPLMDAVLQEGGRARRMAFRSCAVPDAAVARVCHAWRSRGVQVAAEGASVLLEAVCFEDCGLSELAEQQLLVALEQCDGRCVVTVNGGTTRPSGPSDCAEWLLLTADGASRGCARSLPSVQEATGKGAERDKDALIEELRAAVSARDARILELQQELAAQREAVVQRELAVVELLATPEPGPPCDVAVCTVEPGVTTAATAATAVTAATAATTVPTAAAPVLMAATAVSAKAFGDPTRPCKPHSLLPGCFEKAAHEGIQTFVENTLARLGFALPDSDIRSSRLLGQGTIKGHDHKQRQSCHRPDPTFTQIS